MLCFLLYSWCNSGAFKSTTRALNWTTSVVHIHVAPPCSLTTHPHVIVTNSGHILGRKNNQGTYVSAVTQVVGRQMTIESKRGCHTRKQGLVYFKALTRSYYHISFKQNFPAHKYVMQNTTNSSKCNVSSLYSPAVQNIHFSGVVLDLLPSGCDKMLIRWRVSKASSSFSAWLHLPFQRSDRALSSARPSSEVMDSSTSKRCAAWCRKWHFYACSMYLGWFSMSVCIVSWLINFRSIVLWWKVRFLFTLLSDASVWPIFPLKPFSLSQQSVALNTLLL